MKKLLLLIIALLLLSLGSFAQAPEMFKYQAHIMDNKGGAVNNTTIGLQLSIYLNGLNGNLVYQEVYTITTNKSGLVNLEIGTGNDTSGIFSEINWGQGTYFLEAAIDLKGGTNYVSIGASQLLSVPYALFAKKAMSVEGDNDTDPFNEIELPEVDGTTGEVLTTDGEGVVSWQSPAIAAISLSSILTEGNDGDANQIKNIADPTDPQDVVTKAYMDALAATVAALQARIVTLEEVVVTEICGNDIDDNMDGQVDEGCGSDLDGDGITVEQGDCNDQDPTIYPGAPCDDGFICTVNDVYDDDCNCTGTIASNNIMCDPGDGLTPPSYCDGINADCPIPTNIDNDGDGFTVAEGDCDNNDASINPGVIDLPDNIFLDTNCDGVDGNVSEAIFVSVSGNDSNSGDQLNPMRSINAAIQKALSSFKNQIYVSAGTYQERVIMQSGISIYGGYGSDWSRNETNDVIITGVDQNGYVAGLKASSINSTTYLDHINISTNDANGTFQNQGKSNYGIIISSSTSLIINKCDINVGSGSSGLNGVNGASGQAGLAGSNGANGLNDGGGYVPGGKGGYLFYNGTSYAGGNGGNGVYESDGQNGFDGAQRPGGTGGYGGQSGNPGQAGVNGLDGRNGSTGNNGGGGIGSYALGLWYGGDGQNGFDGTPGTGGGGGGAGGGQDAFFAQNGTGNAGGGGGSGGAPGTGGTGGFAGGASIGIILNSSPIQITNCKIETGNGGHGGRGGSGGNGRNGGVGGFGGKVDTSEIGAGGDGGNGGFGDRGGFGGGGAGGPSIGLLLSGSTATTVGNNFVRGSGGAGGLSTGNIGRNGISVNTLSL